MSADPSLAGTLGWSLSAHARARARRRGINTRSILKCIADPEVTYPSRCREIVTRGRLAVVLDRPNRVVVTLLVTGTDAWSDADAIAAFAEP
jgi:hypothetical protein